MNTKLMKKVTAVLFAMLVGLAAMSMGLVKAEAAEPSCRHFGALQAFQAKNPTCTEAGNSAYWYCKLCKKYFSDSSGKNVINKDSWVINATGHNLEATEAVDATCTKAGNSKYWSCTNKGCKKYFSDENGTQEIVKYSWIVNALGHEMEEVGRLEPTCEEPGHIKGYTCSRCNNNYGDQYGWHKYKDSEWILPALGHSPVSHDAVEATCTEDGNVAYWSCGNEGCIKFFADEDANEEIMENSWVIPASHTLAEQDAIEATCENEGKHAHHKCEREECAKLFLQGEEVEEKHLVIPKNDHSWDEGSVTVEPSEDAEGVMTYNCTACTASRTEPIEKLQPTPVPTPEPAPTPEPKKDPVVKPVKRQVSGTAMAKMTTKGKNSLVISWDKINGADGYDVFFSLCNHSSKKIVCEKIADVKANKKLSWTVKGLKKNTAYKAYVKAYVLENGKKKYVRTSPTLHAFTSGYDKNYTNVKSLTVKKANVSIKKGKTYKIKAGLKKLKNNKKIMPKNHTALVRYISSDSKVATVYGSGKVTAKGKGTCYIYVYAHNGICKKVKISVK